MHYSPERTSVLPAPPPRSISSCVCLALPYRRATIQPPAAASRHRAADRHRMRLLRLDGIILPSPKAIALLIRPAQP